MAAVRENEQRAAVLGIDTTRTRLMALVVGSTLAGVGGVAYTVVLGGSTAHLTTSEVTLSFLLMVVLGGTGSTWGVLVGGFLYAYADSRLVALGGESGLLSALPDTLAAVLGQPLFILGLFFVIVVYFAPTGLAGLGRRLLPRRSG